MQRKHLTIDHYIDWRIENELDSPSGTPLRQRMFNMSAIIKRRQVTNQPDAANRTPTNIFDQPIVDFRLGRDHHRAAGKLAVAESKKQAGTTINVFFSIHTQRKRPPPEPRQTNKDGRLISQLSPPAEIAGSQGCHIGGESYTQQINIVNEAVFVSEPQHIARPGAAGEHRLNGIFNSSIGEVAKKRVAGTQRQESQSWRFSSRCERKQSIHNLVGGAVAADGDESPIAFRISISGEFRRLVGRLRFYDINLNAARPQTIKCRLQELSTAPAARCRIDHRKERIAQVRPTVFGM